MLKGNDGFCMSMMRSCGPIAMLMVLFLFSPPIQGWRAECGVQTTDGRRLRTGHSAWLRAVRVKSPQGMTYLRLTGRQTHSLCVSSEQSEGVVDIGQRAEDGGQGA